MIQCPKCKKKTMKMTDLFAKKLAGSYMGTHIFAYQCSVCADILVTESISNQIAEAVQEQINKEKYHPIGRFYKRLELREGCFYESYEKNYKGIYLIKAGNLYIIENKILYRKDIPWYNEIIKYKRINPPENLNFNQLAIHI